MAKSYNDPAKQMARLKQRDFIARNLSYKRPSDLRVLCFPGAEQDGEEGIEIKEVYDPLGIPRGNITGLEMDKSRYERLQRAGLGINPVNASDIEYLAEARKKHGNFDVISLDYTSFFTPDRIYAVDLISGDSLLGTRGILVTNFMGQRENEVSQDYLKSAYGRMSVSGPLETPADFFERAAEAEKLANQFELADDRSNTIKQAIIRTMLLGNSATRTDFYKRFDNYEKNVNLMMSNDDTVAVINAMKGRNFDEKLARTTSFRCDVRHMLYMKARQNTIGRKTIDLFYMLGVRPYFPNAIESYSYTSNSGRPMLFDMGFYDKHERELGQFDDFFSQKDKTLIRIMPGEMNQKKRRERHDKAAQISEKLQTLAYAQLNSDSREYLGSSYVPKPKNTRERISKEDALELLKAGFPPAEISEVYRGFTKMQLAAMKAHLTMGTYDKNTAVTS